MNIIKFFDVYNPEHIKAFWILQNTGMWPKDFVPSDCEMPNGWHISLMAKFTDAWIDCAIKERWPTEIHIDLEGVEG